MKCPFVIKICSKCKKLLVAYNGNFAKKKSGKWGLRADCKECINRYNKSHYENNKEERLEKQKQYYQKNKDVVTEYQKQYNENNRKERLEKQKQYRETHKEEISKKKKKYYNENKEKVLEKSKMYREKNKEKIKRKHKEYYENNKTEILEKNKQYREEHKEEISEMKKQWARNNPEKVFNKSVERRQKLDNQGSGITKEQWLEMMNFFEWKCAYSGEYIGGNSEFRTIDHMTPLSLGGEHEVWNCVPMYANYNYSKNNRNMIEWYKKQEFYSEERLQKIYEWIEYAKNKYKK